MKVWYEKTILEDFMEKHPGVKLVSGTPEECPSMYGYEINPKCDGECAECWRRLRKPYNMTKDEAIIGHRAMWRWIFEKIKAGDKRSLSQLKDDYLRTKGFKLKNDCFACHYKGKRSCAEGCVFNWGDDEEFTPCLDGVYGEYMKREAEDAESICRKILNLPVREDVE